MKKTSLLLLCTSVLFCASLSDEPSSSSLVVYNSGIGLVHEQRTLKLNKNDKQIIYRGVASSIETDSVNVTLPSFVKLYSQQYRFDKLTISKLLDAHIGKEVQVNNKKVTLLSHNASDALARTDKDKIISILSKEIVFESIPDTLLRKPSLVWNIESSKSIDTTMGIDYLIKNLSFKCDYILNLHSDTADLIGWISIDNRSGKSYEDTSLHLLAGDINRVQNNRPKFTNYRRKGVTVEAAPVSQVAHEGYHFYTIPFKVNLANNEKTQIKFISKSAIPIYRKYKATTSNPLYLRGEKKRSVTQYIEIKKLDIPLPKGIVRSYSKLKSQNILLGESAIAHTPRDTQIQLILGKNFDIKVKETIISKDDSKNYLSSKVLYTIKNSSDEPKTVELLVPFNRNKTSTIETKKAYEFKNSNQLSFKITLKARQTHRFNVSFRSKR